MRTHTTILSMISAAVFSVATGASAQDIAGTWLSQTGDTRVRIAPCGGGQCGTIVWVKDNAKDENNPSDALKTRSLVGVRMISDIKSTSTGEYTGSLYNYKDGKTYSGKIKASGATLSLSGCVLGGLICRGQTWSKVN